jgi:hypothetical protein
MVFMLDSISGIPGPTGPAGPTGATGAAGTDGNSIWITYHAADLISAPSDPTGDGESGGWTKTPSFVPNWMSLKISATVSTGTWGNPMAIRGVPGTYVIPDCVARYKLDENDANTAVYDSSGNGFNGAADANTSSLHQSGVFGGCLSFDGSSQNIDCGDVPAFSFTGPFTASQWVRFDAIDRAQIFLHKNLSLTPISLSIQADNKVKSRSELAQPMCLWYPANADHGTWYQSVVLMWDNAYYSSMASWKTGSLIVCIHDRGHWFLAAHRAFL